MKRYKKLYRILAFLLILIMSSPIHASAAFVTGASGSTGTGGSTANPDNCVLIAQWLQSFRVGLSRDPLGEPLTATDSTDTLKKRLETQYSTRYPDNNYREDNWLVMFLPNGHPGIQSGYTNGICYTEYDPASFNLLAYNDPNVTANTMICSSTKLKGSTSVYYSQLKTALGKNTRLDTLLSTWKQMAKDKEASLAYWSYIFEPQGSNNDYSYLVVERMTEKLNPKNINLFAEDLKESDKIDCNLRYIDMLMTLYTLCGSKVRGVWETAVNDYLKGQVLGEKPVYLIIDIVHTLKQGDDSPIYVTSSIDYLQYYCGIDSEHDVKSKTFKGTGVFIDGQTGTGSVYKSVVGWFKKAVDGSVKNSPNANRLSTLARVPTTNGWAWGASAIVHHGRPSTRENNSAGGLLDFYYFQWMSAGMEVLWFPSTGKVPGFCIAGSEYSALGIKSEPVNLSFNITAQPKAKEVTGPVGVRTSLGQNVTITVDLAQSSSSLNSWKKRLAGVKSVDVYMSLQETLKNHTLSCITDSQFSGKSINGTTKVTLTTDDFLKLIAGKLNFEDKISAETLGSNESLKYTYAFSMKVQFKEGTSGRI